MVDGLRLRAFAQTCHGDTRIKRQPLEVMKHAAATITLSNSPEHRPRTSSTWYLGVNARTGLARSREWL